MTIPAPLAMRANGTIRVGRFIKIDTSDNNSVLEADANEQVFGVSGMGGREAPIPSATADPPEAAQAGDNIEIHTLGTSTLLQIGSGGCTAGDYLKSDADGKGVAVAGSAIENVGAIALETASEDEYALVLIQTFTATVA